MKLEFARLSQIQPAEIIALNNNPAVLRHMPLAGDAFTKEHCEKWVKDKEAQWEQNGYGPWAFVIDGRFAGWGGLQYENGDADLALVLHPDYWGYGKVTFQEIVSRAFGQLGLDSITILLPTTRKRIRSLRRLGFVDDGTVDIDGVRFNRYRLIARQYS